MLLTIQREKPFKETTPGTLYIDRQLHCFTLEDLVRVGADGVMQADEKVYGRTAIPAGTYNVILAPFRGDVNRMYPHIQNVPYFTGIFIHGGNNETHTLGCPLVGNKRGNGWIADCAPALSGLCFRIAQTLENFGTVKIEIIDYKGK